MILHDALLFEAADLMSWWNAKHSALPYSPIPTHFLNEQIFAKLPLMKQDACSRAVYCDPVFISVRDVTLCLQHKCYIVATCDRDLKRRIRKIPGVPIMYIRSHKYSIERLPEANMGGAPRV